MSGLFKSLKALFDARKGFRWSLYMVHQQSGLRYALHENAVGLLLGYVLAQYDEGKRLKSDWELFVNFNRTHQSIKLEERYFRVENVSPELWEKIAKVDPEWKVKIGKPCFVDAQTKKELPLGRAYEAAFDTPKEMSAHIEKMLRSPRDDGPTFASVINLMFEDIRS